MTDENNGKYLRVPNRIMQSNIFHYSKQTSKPTNWTINNYNNSSQIIPFYDNKGIPYYGLGTISSELMDIITQFSLKPGVIGPKKWNLIDNSNSGPVYIFRIPNKSNNIIIPKDILKVNNIDWENNVKMLNNNGGNLINDVLPILKNFTSKGEKLENFLYTNDSKGDVYVITRNNIDNYINYKNVLNALQNSKNKLNITQKVKDNKNNIDNNILTNLKNININLDKFNSNKNANINLSDEQKAKLLGKNVQLNKIILNELIKQDSSLSGKTQEQQYALLSSFFDNNRQLAKTLNDMSPDIPLKL